MHISKTHDFSMQISVYIREMLLLKLFTLVASWALANIFVLTT